MNLELIELSLAYRFKGADSLLHWCKLLLACRWLVCICCGSILSLVQILFPLFQTHYHQITITKTKEMKFEPRIKLNHNIYTCTLDQESTLGSFNIITQNQVLVVTFVISTLFAKTSGRDA